MMGLLAQFLGQGQPQQPENLLAFAQPQQVGYGMYNGQPQAAPMPAPQKPASIWQRPEFLDALGKMGTTLSIAGSQGKSLGEGLSYGLGAFNSSMSQSQALKEQQAAAAAQQAQENERKQVEMLLKIAQMQNEADGRLATLGLQRETLNQQGQIAADTLDYKRDALELQKNTPTNQRLYSVIDPQTGKPTMLPAAQAAGLPTAPKEGNYSPEQRVLMKNAAEDAGAIDQSASVATSLLPTIAKIEAIDPDIGGPVMGRTLALSGKRQELENLLSVLQTSFKPFEGEGAISNYERELQAKAQPSITMGAEARLAALAAAKELIKIKQQKQQFKDSFIQQNGTWQGGSTAWNKMMDEKYGGAAGGGASADDDALLSKYE